MEAKQGFNIGPELKSTEVQEPDQFRLFHHAFDDQFECCPQGSRSILRLPDLH
jgi:hypothetical protein